MNSHNRSCESYCYLCDPTFRSNLRCSRPLCSSQNTGGIPHHHQQHRQWHQDPSDPDTLTSAPGPKVRNRIMTIRARSLRTQQRAQTSTPITPRSYQHKAGVLKRKQFLWPQCQCSTHERRPPRTGWYDLASNSAVYRPTCTCSLERR
jgi:hypothetical protein